MDAMIFSLLSQLNPSQSSLFATILWSIWKRMNLKLWQQKTETNSQVVARATTLLDEWKAAQCIRREGGAPRAVNQPEPIRQETIRWQKPARGRYKCNIDASFSSSLNRVGLGMCIRDDAGEYVLARIDWFYPLCDVVIGEAVGLHTALQ
ncbi:uncharacterized protein [Medicago truncatula]|uniref:uncharacterized protein n=1 Tax=Medicago truncatula TaxID=3880 RepID=UPI000D2F2778|nr:uncharacterized protein LOC112422041 [Medicago truncatula]